MWRPAIERFCKELLDGCCSTIINRSRVKGNMKRLRELIRASIGWREVVDSMYTRVTRVLPEKPIVLAEELEW